MVSRLRRFVCAVVLTIPAAVSAQGPSSSTGLPPNLDAGAFRSTIELMWRASPTFRDQCGRLAAKPRLHVMVRSDSSRPLPVVRARTEISRVRGTLTHADIVVSDARDAIELIAHEVEHVIEQIEGVRPGDAVCHGNRPVRAGESCRAIEIGRRVAAEVEESRKNDSRTVRP